MAAASIGDVSAQCLGSSMHRVAMLAMGPWGVAVLSLTQVTFLLQPQEMSQTAFSGSIYFSISAFSVLSQLQESLELGAAHSLDPWSLRLF